MIEEKVEKINRRESPIQDEYIEKFLLRGSWIWWRRLMAQRLIGMQSL